MTRQDKIEAAAIELIEIGAYSKLSKNIVWKELKEALEPEFVPEVGKLYMFDNKDIALYSGTRDDGLYCSTVADFYSECRPLTEQEWVDIGCNCGDNWSPTLAQEAIDACVDFYRSNPATRGAYAASVDLPWKLGKKIVKAKDG